MVALCLVCGSSESDVERLHHFPRNLERAKLWQDAIGIRYNSGSLHHFVICSKHFAPESYANEQNFRLLKHAVPSLFLPCPTTSDSTTSNVPETIVNVNDNITPCEIAIPTTPVHNSQENIGFSQARGCRTTARKGSLLLANLIPGDSTPRKKELGNIIRKSQHHMLKIKRLCRQRGKSLKRLCNSFDDYSVVKNLFKDIPSQTAEFMIAQLRCARRTPKGRRWTLSEKIMSLALLKRSPRCYSLLRRFVALPSRRTILSLLL